MKKTLLAAALVALLQVPALAQTPDDTSVLKLNSEMLHLYDGALGNAEKDLLAHHPVILALFTGQGGQLILYRPGQPPREAPRVPVRYELVKSVGHSSMAIFAHAYAHLGLDGLKSYRATCREALDHLPQADVPEAWRPAMRRVLERNLAFIDRADLSEAALQAFALAQKADLRLLIAWAAETQVGHWMGVLEGWKKELGPAWAQTYGASNTIYVTRQNNILFGVLAQFFGKEALNSRLFLFETTDFTTRPEQMLSLLARTVGDRSVGQAFFHDYYLMDYELMGGDAHRAIEAEDKKRGMTVVLPPLVPFHSSEWPMRHDPAQGEGPASLEEVR